MDLLVVIVLTIGLGIVKINQYGSYEGAQSFVSSEVVQEVEITSEIPIGNNLSLQKESYAFERILIGLGLKKIC